MITISLIPLETILLEECAFIIGFSCTVWIKVMSLLAPLLMVRWLMPFKFLPAHRYRPPKKCTETSIKQHKNHLLANENKEMLGWLKRAFNYPIPAILIKVYVKMPLSAPGYIPTSLPQEQAAKTKMFSVDPAKGVFSKYSFC